jgi:molecular chaperone DnaK
VAKKFLSLGAGGKLVIKSTDGKEEPIQRAVGNPCSVFLLVDCSSSMSEAKISQAKRGALAFGADALRKKYSVGLIRFAEEALLSCEPQNDIHKLQPAIEALSSSGSTNMTDAINLASSRLGLLTGLRAMVLVTDGQPDNAESALEAARDAKSRGIEIITVGTDDADKDFLSKLASRSDLAVKVDRLELGSGIAAAARMLPGPKD